ncbi:MAG: class I SAM-dependent methyltransferase [Thermomicrobiales bacterium]
MPDATPTSDLVSLLASPEALDALAALADLSPGDPVSTATHLRKRFAPEVVAAAMTLHELRTRASSRFSQAGGMLFTRAGYEQASSEAVARWRAERFTGCNSIVDLCCGIGGDLMALAAVPGVHQLTAVDLDPDHLAMALTNARLVASDGSLAWGLADVRTANLGDADGVFIDPARRDTGGRFAYGETEPPLDWCVGLADRVPKVGIKLAPGIDHETIPAGWELELIAVDADLKEAVLWSPALATAPRRATVIVDGVAHSMTGLGDDPQDAETRPLVTPEVGLWLHDPNPAITRAGLVQSLATTLDATPIDRQIAFLVGARPAGSPFARSHRIVASLPWDEKALRRTLTELDAGAIDIRRRGLAGDVDAIAKRLRKRLAKQGRNAYWIAMTRSADRPWAIICEDVPSARQRGD